MPCRPITSCDHDTATVTEVQHDGSALRLDAEDPYCCLTPQSNCASLTNYTLATAPALNEVYNATGLVVVIVVRRFFWCGLHGRGHSQGHVMRKVYTGSWECRRAVRAVSFAAGGSSCAHADDEQCLCWL